MNQQDKTRISQPSHSPKSGVENKQKETIRMLATWVIVLALAVCALGGALVTLFVTKRISIDIHMGDRSPEPTTSLPSESPTPVASETASPIPSTTVSQPSSPSQSPSPTISQSPSPTISQSPTTKSNSPSPEPQADEVVSPLPKNTEKSTTSGRFRYTVKACTRSDYIFICKLLITNNGYDTDLYIDSNRSFVYDYSGNYIVAESVKFANRASDENPGIHLISDATVETTIQFKKNTAYKGDMIAQLEISSNNGTAEISDIPYANQ